MKNCSLCVVGVLVYVIVTIIDVFFVSLPLAMYIVGLLIGSMLILMFFLERLGIQKNNTPSRKASMSHRVRHTVFHLSRQPVMHQLAK